MTESASRALDGDLHGVERFAYRLHLLYCSACRRYARQIKKLRELIAAEDDDASTGPAGAASDSALSSEAQARIAALLREVDQQSS